jgi:hypothetical protein
MEASEAGSIVAGSDGKITFEAKAKGVHSLRLSSEDCAYSIQSSNAPLGIYAGRRVVFVGGSPRLYFNVQKGIEDFAVTVRGSRNQTGRIRIVDPEGEPAGEAQTSIQRRKAIAEVAVGGREGTWSLELVSADEGILGDASIQVLRPPELLPVIALDPQQVFVGRIPPT